MNLFVNKDAQINFSIFVGLSKENNIIAAQTKKELLENDSLISKEEEIKEFTFSFKKPNYRQDVDLMSSTVRSSGDGELALDVAMVRYLRVLQLAKKWNLTDQNGQIIPFNQANIDRLVPVIAALMCSLLEKNINKV